MIEPIIGRKTAEYVNMIDTLSLENLNTRYTFMGFDQFKKLMFKDQAQGMRVYWYEMLARAHCCSVIAILRTRRWLSSMESSASEKNALSFAASFRGLLESVADASTSLSLVPYTLARLNSRITRALSGRLRTIVVSSEIENELIHFSHARYMRNSEATGDLRHHKARTTQQYMDILKEGGVDNVSQCYRELCDMTHPGVNSVIMWLSVSDGQLALSARQDGSVIQGYVDRYTDIFQDLLRFGFNPAIITLAVLNYLTENEFHTPKLVDWDLSSIDLWRRCREVLRNRKVRAKPR